MQWIHIEAMNTKPKKRNVLPKEHFLFKMIEGTDPPKFPTRSPLFLIASGIARMPVPMLPLSKWMMVSVLDMRLLDVLSSSHPSSPGCSSCVEELAVVNPVSGARPCLAELPLTSIDGFVAGAEVEP